MGCLRWPSFPEDGCQHLQTVWTVPAGQGVLWASTGEARDVAHHPEMRRTPQHRLRGGGRVLGLARELLSCGRTAWLLEGTHRLGATDGRDPWAGVVGAPTPGLEPRRCSPARPAQQHGGSGRVCPQHARPRPPCPATN